MKYHLNKKETKRLSKRFIRHSKKQGFASRKKKLIVKKENVLDNLDNPSPILSPYNSNEYLIRNQSSAFFDDEEEEDFSFQPSELFDLVNGLKEIKDSESTSDKMDSTYDESEIINNAFRESKKKFEETCTEIQKK